MVTRKLGKAQPIELNPLGVVLDVPPYAAPPDVYTECRNYRVTGGGMRRADGVKVLLPDAGPYLFDPQFLQVVTRQGEIVFLYAGSAGVGATDGIAHYDVTPSTGWLSFANGQMTGTVYNGIACLNTDEAPPWYWDGTYAIGGVKPLPGFLPGSRCKVLTAFGSHLFAGSIIDGAGVYNERLAWSDVAAYGAVPGTWTPTATNQAGEIQLTTGAGGIVAMRGLGSNLIVYRATGCYAVSYVGRPYIYTARKLSADVGAASRNSVAEAMGQHIVLAPGDIVITDGVTWRSIGESRVKRALFSQISEAGLAVAHVCHVPGKAEILFNLPIGRDDLCNTIYAWNYAEDRWSVRDAPLTAHTVATFVPEATAVTQWDTDAGTWDSDYVAWNATPQGGYQTRAAAACPSDSVLRVLDVGDLDREGLPIKGKLERLSMPLGDVSTVKLVTRIFPRVNATAGTVLRITPGGQIEGSDAISWEPAQLYTVGSSEGVTCSVMGRFISLRIECDTIEPHTISGFGIEYRERGYQ